MPVKLQLSLRSRGYARIADKGTCAERRCGAAASTASEAELVESGQRHGRNRKAMEPSCSGLDEHVCERLELYATACLVR